MAAALGAAARGTAIKGPEVRGREVRGLGVKGQTGHAVAIMAAVENSHRIWKS